MTTDEVRDLIIIGSGPAGYTAAIYAARAQLAPLVFEGTQFGGALMTTTEVENYPGFTDGIMGPELMDADARPGRAVRRRAAHRGRRGGRRSTGPVKTVTVGNGRHLPAPRRDPRDGRGRPLPDVPGEQQLLGRGVSACATCDGFFFRDQDIAVVGGGDSAMEEATFLTRFARSVTIVHRRDEFRASQIMLERARNDPKIRWRTNAEVTEVLGEGSVTGSCVCATPAPARSRRSTSPACSSRSATTRAASWSAIRSTPTTRATCWSQAPQHAAPNDPRRVRLRRPRRPHLPAGHHGGRLRLCGRDRRRALARRRPGRPASSPGGGYGTGVASEVARRRSD